MKFIVTLLSVLTLTIGVTTSSALVTNQALSLDGDGDYMEVADSPSLDLSSQFTISLSRG